MRNVKLSILFTFAFASAFSQWKYPDSKKVEVIETYFGVDYKDNYRWLEDMKNPEVESWFKQQADFSNSTMSNISGRDELIAEWRKLDKLQPAAYSNIVKEGGRTFFKKKIPMIKPAKNMSPASRLLYLVICLVTR